MNASLHNLRQEFHRNIVKCGLLSMNSDGIASNADKGNRASVFIAASIAEQLGVRPTFEKMKAQTAGHNFEAKVTDFLQSALTDFKDLSVGRRRVEHVLRRGHNFYLAEFEPYRHLAQLADAVTADSTLSTVLGNSYDISPDVVLLRSPEPDEFFNQNRTRVDDSVALHSPLRLVNNEAEIVEGIISCKWTLRSDRAQNARSEALNIIRNRKGRTPHIVVVTGEPTPSRLASLALGTGDIDMVYHFALPELQTAVEASGNDEAKSMLNILIEGKRLRDISDLAIDVI
ncbi:NgoMIV family type II restriction endonuclease [Rothia terrae]|uniref:NgoMIV family type II restriction endonuclease n=1 Tax=Rothia terrae TaxID=396015 RepID=UPI0033E64A57